MLRAVRFAAQLDFFIEEGTRGAMKGLASRIGKVSAERIQAELVKLLLSGHPKQLLVAYYTGLTAVFFPEFDRMMETPQHNPHHCFGVGEHTVESLAFVPPEKALRLAMLLHDVAKPCCRTTDGAGVDHFYGHPAEGSVMARAILKRLRFDNQTMDFVCRLIRWHDDNPELSGKAVRKAVNRIGTDCFPALFAVKRADILAQGSYLREEKLSYVSRYEQLWRRITEEGQCLTIKDLAVNGKDLIADGMAPGPGLGRLLQELLVLVLEDPSQNTKENLLMQAHKMKNPHI